MNLTLKVWRQQNAKTAGKFVTYQVQNVTPDMSFLEMLDLLNENLQTQGEAPVVFEHDCREGICGSCGFLINGVAHGGHRGTTVCQLSMRFFKDGDSLTLEPWRAKAFPVLRDLAVDRSAFDRIIQAGGFITAPTGGAPDANAILVPKDSAERAFDAAACIGCGACVAACPNAAAMLFYRREDHAPQLAAARPAAARPSHAGHGRGDVPGSLRQLHEPRRMRGGLPQENPHRVHRPDESRPDPRHAASSRKVAATMISSRYAR